MLRVGTKLGPYEIVAPIGAGGMGEVYKARDTRLDRTVALKVLPAHVAADPQFRERFDREARAISQLTHPNICTLYDIGRSEVRSPEGLRHIATDVAQGFSPEPSAMTPSTCHGVPRRRIAGGPHREGTVARRA